MSQVVRIQEDAKKIALNYGPTISEGIRVMEHALRRQKAALDSEDIRMIIREELESFGRY